MAHSAPQELESVRNFSEELYVTVNCLSASQVINEATLKDTLNRIKHSIDRFRLNTDSDSGKLICMNEKALGTVHYMIFYKDLESYEAALTAWDEAHPKFRHHRQPRHFTFNVSLKNDEITKIHTLTRTGHNALDKPTMKSLQPFPIKAKTREFGSDYRTQLALLGAGGSKSKDRGCNIM